MKKLFTTRGGKVGSAVLAAAVIGAASLGVASAASAHDNRGGNKPRVSNSAQVQRTHTPRPTQAAALKFVERQDVVISGSTTVGSTLTINPGIYEPAGDTVTYQWQRNGVNIPDATATEYVLTAEDAGTQIRIVETVAKASYKTEVEHSNRLWIPAA
ncbi:MAG: hypothetical protein RLZZ600_1020 [Actinomycetota bacterium]